MRLRSIFILLSMAITFHGYSQAIGTWSSTGPVLFPVNVSGQVDGMGRVSQLKFHTSNPGRIYAVSSSGGLFITNDTGKIWVATAGTDALPTTACSAVCVDYTNDNILYLSTGDQNYYSDWYGIYKSTDGGATWNPANVNIGNRMAVEIIMDPLNHTNLVAATDDGVWKTTDGGATWTEKIVGGTFKSMKQKPGSNTILYAASDQLFYRSTDMGTTWTNITTGITVPTGNQGIRIAVTPADPNIVYLGTTDGYGEILKSTDEGTTFTNIYSSTTQCIVCYDSTITSGSQGYYNFNLTVNPTNANELLLVSHCVWRSTDGGLTWSWRTQWYNQVHTDMHDIEFDPFDPSMRFNANDGGVWLSKDTLATYWTPSSDGLSATEIYHAAQSPVTREMVSIGTQDNGELYYDGVWKCNRGGDWGARNFFDYLSNSTVYYTQDGNRRNLAPLGGDQSFNCPFQPNNNATMEFVPSQHNEVFAGIDTLWRSMDINTTSPTWTMLYVPGANMLSIASCRADNNILYFVGDNSLLYRSDNAQSSSPTFTSFATPASTSVNSSVATDKYNANVVYLSCGTNIYRSANKGATWTNITGALPSLNIQKVISDEYSTNERLFVSEGSYVYYKDNSTPWTLTGGLPTVASISDFMIYNDSTAASILRIGTYGRGVWECNINNNFPPTGSFAADKQYLCPGDTVHYSKTLYGNLTSFVWHFPGGSPSTSTAPNPTVIYPSVGSYAATLIAVGPGGNDTITYANYITVSNGGGAITEGFEEAVFPPTIQWTLESQSGVNWRHTDSCGGYGLSPQSIFFDNFNNDAGGRHDRIVSPKINLTYASSAYVTFDVAYAYYSGYHDSLQVEISTDCGRTFTRIYEKDSEVLATAPNTSASFVPTSSQWRTDTVYLTAYLGHEAQLAFDNIGHYGENLYIDNINIGGELAVNNVNQNDKIQVFPNPTDGMVNIKAQGLRGSTITVSCYNVTGSLLTQKKENLYNGSFNTSLNLGNLPKGIYELKLVDGEGNSYIKKVVLQ